MTRICRWTLLVAFAVGLLVSAEPRRGLAQQQAQPPQQVASVEQLKNQAFDALKSGKFDQSNELLAKAASISPDPNLHQMADWVKQFETQRQEFTAERHKQYEKAVADVHKLLEHHHDSYALDQAAKACLLSDDKKAFRNEP